MVAGAAGGSAVVLIVIVDLVPGPGPTQYINITDGYLPNTTQSSPND